MIAVTILNCMETLNIINEEILLLLSYLQIVIIVFMGILLGHFSSSFLIKLETRDRTVDSSKCGSENFENVPNPSVSNDDPSEVQYHIADIQDNLDLSPVSRKLSDVVVGQVYASNMDRVERKAEDILTMSKTSRENIFHTLRNVLNVNESPPVFRTAVNVDIQPADQEKGRTEVKRAEVNIPYLSV